MKSKLNPTKFKVSITEKKLDFFVCVSLILISLFIWIPHRFYPFHWDAAGFLNHAVENLLITNFVPLIATNSDFSHPPLFIALIALVFQLFGRNLLIAHSIMYPFLPLLTIASYYLAKKTGSTLVSVATAALTLVTPVVLAEYLNIYIDLPAASLALSSLALFVYRKPKSAILFLTLGILTKLTALLVVPAMLIYAYKTKTYSVKELILILGIPLILLSAYLIYHYHIVGWVFTKPTRAIATPNNFSDLLDSLWYVCKSIFFDQGRFLLTLTALIFIMIASVPKKLSPTAIIPVTRAAGLSLLSSIVYFTLSGEFAFRYAIITYPLLYLVCLNIIYISLKKYWPEFSTIIFMIYAFICFCLQIYFWHPAESFATEYRFRPPADLSVIDFITLNRLAAIQSQISYRNHELFGGFPENIYFSEPIHGYVTEPLNIKLCTEFTFNPEAKQFIIIHPYSPSQLACRQLLDQLEVTPVERFESGSQWLEMYEVKTDVSAENQ